MNDNFSELIQNVEDSIQSVINGSASKYINYRDNGVEWTIRVSNHGANPERITENTISLVVELPEYESDEYSSFSVNKKKFKNIPNQFYLNETGDFTENFRDIQECLDYIIN